MGQQRWNLFLNLLSLLKRRLSLSTLTVTKEAQSFLRYSNIFVTEIFAVSPLLSLILYLARNNSDIIISAAPKHQRMVSWHHNRGTMKYGQELDLDSKSWFCDLGPPFPERHPIVTGSLSKSLSSEPKLLHCSPHKTTLGSQKLTYLGDLCQPSGIIQTER